VSVIDELKGLEDRVAQRMSELRPLVDEYRELEQVAQRLGVTPSAAADGSSPPRRSRRRARPRAAANASVAANAGGSRSNGRRDELLAMVKARPGITVREIGTELGVDPTSLYRIVHRLEADGAVKKRGRELLPG
jgi:phage terminase small subunit